MRRAIVIVGAQWGDEGKGKIVDIYTEHADMVVRFGGGPNAGHTLVVGNDKLVVRLVPSGILRKDTTCVLAQGMVIDPRSLVTELDELERRGIETKGRLLVSDRAHVILPYHVLVDGLREKGKGAIGTTLARAPLDELAASAKPRPAPVRRSRATTSSGRLSARRPELIGLS